MPPAIVAAGIGAAGALGGAALSSRASGKASEAQSKSTDAALAFEREKEAARRKEYEQGIAAWAAGRRLLAQRYGLNPDEVMPPGSIGVGAAPATGAPAMASGGAPQNIGALLGGQTGPPEDIGKWSDWARYGLG